MYYILCCVRRGSNGRFKVKDKSGSSGTAGVDGVEGKGEEDESLSDSDVGESPTSWVSAAAACSARLEAAKEAERRADRREKVAIVTEKTAERKLKAAEEALWASERREKTAIVAEKTAERKRKDAEDALRAAVVKGRVADDARRTAEAKTKAAEKAVQTAMVMRRVEGPLKAAVKDVEEVYQGLLKLGLGSDESMMAQERMKLQNSVDRRMASAAIDSFKAVNRGLSRDAAQQLQFVKEESALYLEKRRCQAVAEMYSLTTALQDNNSVMLNAVTANVGHLVNLLGDILDDLLKVVEEE